MGKVFIAMCGGAISTLLGFIFEINLHCVKRDNQSKSSLQAKTVRWVFASRHLLTIKQVFIKT